MTKKIALWLIVVDIVAIVVLLIFGDIVLLQNFEIGFVSAILILSASMHSYKKMITKRLESILAEEFDDRDVIDKLDDPHSLYDDKQKLDTEDIKEIIKAEKKLAKQNSRSLSETFRDSKASFSIFRIGAYVVFFVGFLYLNKNHLLNLPIYISGVSVSIVVIISALMSQKDSKQ